MQTVNRGTQISKVGLLSIPPGSEQNPRGIGQDARHHGSGTAASTATKRLRSREPRWQARNQKRGLDNFAPLRMIELHHDLNRGEIIFARKSNGLVTMFKMIGKTGIIRPNAKDAEEELCFDVLQ